MLPGLAPALAGLAGAGGVAPNAVNWANIVVDPLDGFASNAEKTITGIGDPIALRAEISSKSGGSSDLYPVVDASSPGSVSAVDGAGIEFTVNLNSVVYFLVTLTGGVATAYTVTVKYKSAGSSTFDQTLDTFTVS